jgi:tetratricopeptide (TPR) repeat protein
LIDEALYDEVIAIVNQIQGQDKNPNFVFYKGLALYKKKDFKNAISTLENLTSYTGLTPEIKADYHFVLGLAYRDIKNTELAHLHFTKALHGALRNIAEIELDELDKPNTLVAKNSNN